MRWRIVPEMKGSLGGVEARWRPAAIVGDDLEE
jgi:hypothetical protein